MVSDVCSARGALCGAERVFRWPAQNDWRFKNHVSREIIVEHHKLIKAANTALDNKREHQSVLRRAFDYELWQKQSNCW